MKEQFKAEVRWCTANAEANSSGHNVGVRFRQKSYPVIRAVDPLSAVTRCDLCRQQIQFGQVHEIVDAGMLCSECLTYINSLDTPTRESIEQIFIGNII